jgi:hypothetical protein
MRKLAIGIFATLLVAGIFTLLLQRETQARLRDEIARFCRQNSALGRIRRENQRLAESQIPSAELARLRNDQRDLPQMRSALASAKLQLMMQTQFQAANGPPKPLAGGMTPVASLTDAGQGTPHAAAQSFFWAVGQIDPDAMAKQLEFAAEARAKADALFASFDEATRQRIGTPEKMMAIFFVEMYGRTTGLQVLGYNQAQAADWGAWRVKVQTASGRLHDVDFPVHQSADGWHEVILPHWIDDWSRYLR